MKNEKVITSLADLSPRALFSIIFETTWSTDHTLYKNLDEHFDAFRCRHAVTDEEKNFLRNSESYDNPNYNDILLKALAKSDHNDVLKFNWTFVSKGGNSKNSLAYPDQKENPYAWIIPYIKGRTQQLKDQHLYFWNRSEDHSKHSYFRQKIERTMTNENSKYYRLNLIDGSNFHRVSDYSDMFSKIFLQHILDANICPDTHNKELEYHCPLESGDYPRMIKGSWKNDTHGELFYITALDMYAMLEQHKLIMPKDTIRLFEYFILCLCSLYSFFICS